MFSRGRRNDSGLPMNGDAIETRYVMGELIGSGCSGCVRECIDLRNQQRCACKTILKQDRCLSWSDVFEDARLEVDTMRTASAHPHVVELRGTFEDDRGIHLVMELCEGGDLFDEIKKGYFPEWLAAYIFRQIVDAVSFCHSVGIMHRDIKPENLFLARRLCRRAHRRRSSLESLPSFRRGDKEALPYVKLGDFGLAVRVDSGGFSPAYGFAGSPFYAAPEVIKGELYGLPADIWSLGVVLYTLLAGNLPFAGETDQETFRQVCKGRPSFSSPAWQYVSSEAKILIRQMLSLDPRCRPSALQILHHPWLQAMCMDLSPPPSQPGAPPESAPSKTPEMSPCTPVKSSVKSLVKGDQFCDAPSTPGGSCYPLPVRRAVEEAHSKPRFAVPHKKNHALHPKAHHLKNASPSPLSFTTPPKPDTRPLSNPPCPSPLTLSPMASSNFPSNPSSFNSIVSSLDRCSSPSTPLYVMSASSPPGSPYSSPSPYPSPASMLPPCIHNSDDDIPFLALKPNCKDYMLSEDGCILFTADKLATKPKTLLGTPTPVKEPVGSLQSEPNPTSSPSSPLLVHLLESQGKPKTVDETELGDLKDAKKRMSELGKMESVKVLSGKEGFNDWRFDITCFLQSLPWSCLQERSKVVPKSGSLNDANKG